MECGLRDTHIGRLDLVPVFFRTSLKSVLASHHLQELWLVPCFLGQFDSGGQIHVLIPGKVGIFHVEWRVRIDEGQEETERFWRVRLEPLQCRVHSTLVIVLSFCLGQDSLVEESLVQCRRSRPLFGSGFPSSSLIEQTRRSFDPTKLHRNSVILDGID